MSQGKKRKRPDPARKVPKFQYSEVDMEAAIAAVQRGETPFAVSKKFKVPRSTLVNKATGVSSLKSKMGPKPTMGVEVEQMIVNWVSAMALRGFPITKADLILSIKQLVQSMNIESPFKDDTPGRKWLQLFFNRHPILANREVEKLSKTRAQVSKEQILKWFEEVSYYLKENSLDEVVRNRSRVFNMDETGFMLCPKTGKVLAVKGQKNVYDVHHGSDKESITVLCTVCADGRCPPPLVVFPGQRLPAVIKTSVPTGWSLGKSDKGWMNGEVFFEYITNEFFPWVKEKEIQLPIVLFIDGHRSHLTYHLSKFCSENGIILISLPPNTTHILQPLDVALFRPIKLNWAKTVHERKMDPKANGEPLTKHNFAPLLKTVLDKTISQKTVENGFRACGLYPFDSQAVDYSKCSVQSSEKHTEIAQSNTQIVDHEEGIGCLNYIESFISPHTLQEFITTYNLITPIWGGNPEAHDLYVLWKKIKDKMQGTQTCPNPQEDRATSYPFVVSSPTHDNFFDYQFEGPLDDTDFDIIMDTTSTTQPMTPKPTAHTQTMTPEPTALRQPMTPEPTSHTQPKTPERTVHRPQPMTPQITAHMHLMTPQPAHTQPMIPHSTAHKHPMTSQPTACTEQSTPQPSCSKSSEKRDKISKVLSPETQGKGVPSPLKDHLFWPDTPKKKKNNTRKRVKMPCVISSEKWIEIEKRKKDKKEHEEKEKAEKKQMREEKKQKKDKRSKSNLDIEEDWVCKVCERKYSSELIKKQRRRWVECDECHSTFHYKCCPKAHLNLYGLDEDDDDDDEVAFICHFCVKDSSDNEFNLLESEESDLE